jgi:hypothetical protein
VDKKQNFLLRSFGYKTLEKLKEYIGKQKKLSSGQLEIILALIKNEE